MKSLLWFLLVFGAVGSLSVSRFLQGTELTMATVTMLVISLVAGSVLAQMEPLKSFLAQRKVLWFLFVVNLNAAVAAYLFLDGAKGLMTGLGLGVVALGAGAGLVTRRRKPEAA